MLSFAARPLIYVGYFSYFQLNIDYIIEKYCVNKDAPQLSCNGKCHLSKQLQISTTEEDDSKAISTLGESFFPVFLQKLEAVNFLAIKSIDKRVLFTEINNYKFSFTSRHLRPPIV